MKTFFASLRHRIRLVMLSLREWFTADSLVGRLDEHSNLIWHLAQRNMRPL